MPTRRHPWRTAVLASCQTLLTLSVAACGDDRGPELADSLARANALLERRQYEPSLAAFDEVLAIDPGHADARGLKAEILLNMARLDEAAEILVGLREEMEEHTGAMWLLAMVRKDQGRFAEAVELFEALPESRRPKIAMAEALTGVGRHDDAADRVGEALVEDPWETKGYYALSTIDFRRGRDREAEMWGDHYLSQESGRAAERKARGLEFAGKALDAKLCRAESLYERGELHGAMTVLQQVARTPQRGRALLLLGRILSDLGQSAEAIRTFEELLARQPGRTSLQQLIAKEKSALQAAGREARTPLDMARFHAALRRTERARAAALFAAKQQSPDPAALRLVGELFDRDQDAFVRLWAWRLAISAAPGDQALRAAWEAQLTKLDLRLVAPTGGR